MKKPMIGPKPETEALDPVPPKPVVTESSMATATAGLFENPEALSPTSQISDAAHLDPAPEPAPELPPVSDRVGTGHVSREAFAAGHLQLYAILSGLTGLKSLAVQEDEIARANTAADALYDTALEVSWLRFLIEPPSAWMQRAIAIGAFVGPHAVAVLGEVKARRIAAEGDDGASPDPIAGSVDAAGGDPMAQFEAEAAGAGQASPEINMAGFA